MRHTAAIENGDCRYSMETAFAPEVLFRYPDDAATTAELALEQARDVE
jgi:hypothetical protein